MLPNSKRAVLQEHPLFSQLDRTEREQILMMGVERQFDDGQIIFQRGDIGNSMMLVLRGEVKISILSDEGKELIFRIIPSGECFGEIALLDGQPRSADAKTVGECDLFVLLRQDFIPFLERHPRVATVLLTVLCGRLRATSDFIERLAFQNTPARLARLLVNLAATHGMITPSGVRIAHRLSQQNIGNTIATSRESVNKQLRLWRTQGLLTVERGHIILLQPAELARIAQSA